MITVQQIRDAYYGSDGQLTMDVMSALYATGDDGKLAALLWRAQKNSTRAKKYRKRDHSRQAYERKNDSIQAIADYLTSIEAEAWGWGRDYKTEGFTHVLYVDLPNGQCSFHSAQRGVGRDYDGRWEPSKGSEQVILEYCELVYREWTQKNRIEAIKKYSIGYDLEQAEQHFRSI